MTEQYSEHDLRMRDIISKRQHAQITGIDYMSTIKEDAEFAKMLSKGVVQDIKRFHKETFIKADTNKNMLSLIEPQFIIKLGEILTFGAAKYAINNWQLCEDPTRYKDALLRHTYAYLGGELLDPESGIEHTACMAFNTMALQWFDNKPKD